MLFRDELPPQEQLNVVMRTVQLIVKPARASDNAKNFRIAIASDFARANLSKI